jgi:hypothetical protein
VAAYKAIPFILRNLSIVSVIGGSIGILLILAPSREVPREPILVGLLFLLPMLVFGVGAFLRLNWIRAIWPILILFAGVGSLGVSDPADGSSLLAQNLPQSIVTAVAFIPVAAYFWRSRKLRAYFQSPRA